jgi:hypothetical protein
LRALRLAAAAVFLQFPQIGVASDI